ncbi:MAG: SAM-dependent DNA methyltransferase [Candidatus Heimdallarchaeota archaeon]|nr:SAM-dependent DNA methyltransferase [Candidatus Heimdallarchaeota archaeon]
MKIINQQELETHLWASADILRGSIDSSDYKHYIFGLLFLKRMNDVFVEHAHELEDKYSDKELAWNDPDQHQFFVPKRARWYKDDTFTKEDMKAITPISSLTLNIGEELDKAMAALEDNNSNLEGVLRNIVFNDKEKLKDRTLSKLIKHYSEITLGNNNLRDPDLLGRAYEYLISRFADDSGKKGGEFYTPQKVVELIVRLLKPEESMRINDPTVGSGGFLINTIHYLREQRKRQGKDEREPPIDITLTGQEKNINTWGICKMNLLLHGLPDAKIEKGDTIRDPKLINSENQLMKFDRVMANPPFSLKNWGIEDVGNDPFNRFSFGLPPKSYGELAFLQHMYSTLNDQGILGIVMPQGVLFRGGSEGKIRKALLQEDLIEAVIGLPSNLFYGTSIPGSIIIINKNKQKSRKNKVLFIYAGEGFEIGKSQNLLRDEDIQKIVNTYESFDEVENNECLYERFASVASINEIKDNDFVLNITMYVDITEPEEQIDLSNAISEWKESIARKKESVKLVIKHLEELKFE